MLGEKLSVRLILFRLLVFYYMYHGGQGLVPMVPFKASSTRRKSSLAMALKTWLELGSMDDLCSLQDRPGRSPYMKHRLLQADAIILKDMSALINFDSYPKFNLHPNVILLQDGELHDPFSNRPLGTCVNITDHDKALAAIGSGVQWILAVSSEEDGLWQMMPAEKLICRASGTRTKIALHVNKIQDVELFSRTLDFGVDALCVQLSASDELWDAVVNAGRGFGSSDEILDAVVDAEREDLRAPNDFLDAVLDDSNETTFSAEQRTNVLDNMEHRNGYNVKTMENISYTNQKEGETSEIITGFCWRMPTPAGSHHVITDHVFIDFVQKLYPSEGCFVGSSETIMALVLSEACASTSPSRSFRIDAGPVHSYVVMADGVSTKFLSELQAGDKILIYDSAAGTRRSIAIGRLELEEQPCVMIGLSSNCNGAVGQLFLREAESVRLGRNYDYIRVSNLELPEKGSALGNEFDFSNHMYKHCRSILLRVTPRRNPH